MAHPPSGRPAAGLRRSLLAALVLAGLSATGAARAVDWSSASATDLSLFYPGQVSWERAVTAAQHKGAAKIRSGETCHSCHAGEEADMGASQAALDGFTGRSALTVQLRAVAEGGMLHLQLSGPANGAALPAVAVMLGNAVLKSTAQAGCWAACHDDAPGMKSDSGQKLGKYLARSRSRNTVTGGGDSVRPAAELETALAAGEFLELLEVDAAGQGERAHVLERVHERAMSGASMRLEGGRWIAELQRPLAAAGSGEIALEPGQVYHLGVAVHEAGGDGRKHLVSLAKSLAIGAGTADIVAATR